MSLLYIDGMGHYATDEIDKKYTVLNTGGSTWAITAEGRFHNALRKHSTSNGGFFYNETGYVQVSPLMIQTGPWTPQPSGVVGFAIKVDDLDLVRSVGNHHIDTIWRVQEGQGEVLAITLNPAGTFNLYCHLRGGSGEAERYLGTSIQGIRSNVWAYLEIKWLISETVGYLELLMNGVVIARYDGNTEPSSWIHPYTNIWNTMTLLNFAAAGANIWMCDLYLADLQGSGDDIRDYLGDITIDYIVPDGVGYINQWTPLSGANWENVEEVPPDEDTTYVSTVDVGHRDSYSMQNVPAGTVPLGFQTLLYARKETEGGASLQPTFRQTGITYDSNTQGISTPDEYRYMIQPYDTNPATGVAITETEINAAEFGVLKVI